MEKKQKVKIIGLNGSPHRNGNTVTLMNYVLEGCRQAGAEVELLHVVDYHIEYCQGCNTCLRTGKCAIPDDLATLDEKLSRADGLVIGSPVYADAPTAQLKTLLDRLTLLNLFTHAFDHQHTVGVATSGIAPTSGVAKNLARFFGRPSGIIGATTSSMKYGYQSLAEVHPINLPEKAHRLGRRLVQDIQAPERVRLPGPKELLLRLLIRLFLIPMMKNNPQTFAGALGILRQKGMMA